MVPSLRESLSFLAITLWTAAALSAGAQSDAFERIQLRVGGFVFDALAAGPENGDLVLLLHGFPETSYSFRNQITALAHAGYRAVAPDQRGYSPGARPDKVSDYALGLVVEDAVGFADALGREKFDLVGHDWGGAVAWVVATRYPDRVRSLTVLATPHFAAFGAALANPHSEQAKRSAYFSAFSAPGAEEKFLANDAAFLRGLFQGSGLGESDIQVYVDALGQPEAIGAALNWYRQLTASSNQASRGPTASPPPSIHVPTLYIWGDQDSAFSRETAEASGQFVDAPYLFVVLENYGHWLPEQAPGRVNQLLLGHLEKSRGR